jgi:hypothetical protein
VRAESPGATLDVIWSEAEAASRFYVCGPGGYYAYQRQLGQFRQTLLDVADRGSPAADRTNYWCCCWGLAPLSRLVSELRLIEAGEKNQLTVSIKQPKPVTEGLKPATA